MTHRLGPALRVLAVVVLAVLCAVPSAGLACADEVESTRAAVLVDESVPSAPTPHRADGSEG